MDYSLIRKPCGLQWRKMDDGDNVFISVVVTDPKGHFGSVEDLHLKGIRCLNE